MAVKSKGKSSKGAKRPKKPAHPWASARVAPDRQTVIIEFLPGSGAKGSIKFDRDEFTRYIRFHGDVRREMPPLHAPKNYDDLKKTHAPAIDARWYAEVLNDFSGSQICFDHPCFGHVRFFFPRADLDALINLLAFHLRKIEEHANTASK
jgi:hypothetical protein